MHTFIFLYGKNIILCILKGILPFKMHKKTSYSENLKKLPGFTSIKVGLGYPKHRYFSIWSYD